MTNKVTLEITSCRACPNWNEQRFYTADSFETVFEWTCKKSGNRIALVEWNDVDPNIPSECPLL